MIVFLAGGLGEFAATLVEQLSARGHRVRALGRNASELPPQVEPVTANPADPGSFTRHVQPCDAYVLLLESAPGARKAEFHSAELAVVRASVKAAADAEVAHFVYAAMPAKSMRDHVIQCEGERIVRETGLPATVLRCGDQRSIESQQSIFREQAPDPPSTDVAMERHMLSSIIAAVETPSDRLRVVITSRLPGSSSPRSLW